MGNNNSHDFEKVDYESGLSDIRKRRLDRERKRRYKRRLAMTPKQMGCCAICCKKTVSFMSTIVYIINALFLVLGALIIAAGTFAFVKLGEISEFMNFPLSIAMIVLGSCVLFLSFLGCIGAYCKSKTVLKIYLFFLLLVVLAQVGVGVGIYFKKDSAESEMNKTWDHADTELRTFVQDEFDCCGWKTIYDDPATSDHCPYNNGTYTVSNSTNDQISKIKYEREEEQQQKEEEDKSNNENNNENNENNDENNNENNNENENNDNHHLKPCKSKVVDFVVSQLNMLELSAIIVGSVQLVALLLSFCLIFLIRPDQDEDEFDGYQKVQLLEDF